MRDQQKTNSDDAMIASRMTEAPFGTHLAAPSTSSLSEWPSMGEHTRLARQTTMGFMRPLRSGIQMAASRASSPTRAASCPTLSFAKKRTPGQRSTTKLASAPTRTSAISGSATRMHIRLALKWTGCARTSTVGP